MPRFSLVMTTCDRPNLLPASVRAVLDMSFVDFELIVSDNHSTIPAREILGDFHDSRIRHIRADRRLAAPDHWEFAWDHVEGDFVMYLGDDNALHPDILRRSDIFIRRHQLDVLSWRSCMYFHPDWNIAYGSFPDRGNILGIDLGTTDELYLCRQDTILRRFCDQLQMGYFPVMCNLLFRKSCADEIRRRMGGFFWAPNPDISATYLILGTTPPGRYAFFDGFGSIAGWSQDSNVATMLSRGSASKKGYDYFQEFHGQDPMPHHDFKFLAYTNMLAATISQARKLMPDYFGEYDFSVETLARRTIDNMYVEHSIPWVDDPAFLAQVDEFLRALPVDIRTSIYAYRDECMERMRKTEAEAKPAAPATDERNTGSGQHWLVGTTTFVDMGLFGAQDIAGTARNFERALGRFGKSDNTFVAAYRDLGVIGEQLRLGDGGSQEGGCRIKRAL
jgi:glycosyltransferase involved in cell wall biosynthesis